MDEIRRGAIVTAAPAGEKPRPALVVQADFFNEAHATITVVPISGAIIDAPFFRVTLDPSAHNGLKKVSQVMVDKVTAIRRERIGRVIGRVEDEFMIKVTRALAVWLGIA